MRRYRNAFRRVIGVAAGRGHFLDGVFLRREVAEHGLAALGHKGCLALRVRAIAARLDIFELDHRAAFIQQAECAAVKRFFCHRVSLGKLQHGRVILKTHHYGITDSVLLRDFNGNILGLRVAKPQ